MMDKTYIVILLALFKNAASQPETAELACNFQNKSLCHWYQERNDGFYWSVGNLSEIGSTSLFIPPPKEAPDSYLFVESDFNHQSNSQAIIKTSTLHAKNETYLCFSFLSYMFGPNAGNLTLTLIKPLGSNRAMEGHSVLWKNIGTQMDAWEKNYVRIFTTGLYELEFRADIGNDGVMALDDFEVLLKDCPVSRTFMKIRNTDTSGSNVKYGILKSPKYSSGLGSQCMHFWYYLHAAGIGSLSVHAGVNDKIGQDALWIRGSDYGTSWKLAQIPVTTYEPFQIFLKASFPSENSDESISVDDISLEPDSCTSEGSCTFNVDFCGYTNDIQDDDFDWQLGIGRTQDPKEILGPIVDSSGHRGMFLYVDFTSPFTNGFARIRSDPIIKARSVSPEFCVEFSYLLYGKGNGRLTVSVIEVNSTHTSSVEVWSGKADSDNPEWKKTSIPVSSNYEFELVFEAKKDSFQRNAFVAIDNVIVTNSICADSIEPSRNTTEPEPTEHSCDFENTDTCQWTDVSVDAKQKWFVGNGKSSGGDRPPEYDHTLNSHQGKYLYFFERYIHASTTVRLRSQSLSSYQACFTFWYYLYGTRVGSLNIKQIDGNQEDMIWNKQANLDRVWRYGQVVLQPLPKSSVIIEATFTQKDFGFIAVDDINITPGTCPPQRLCSFDDDMCGVRQPSEDGLFWNLVPNPIKTSRFPMDHTTNSRFGKYLYLDTTGHSEANTSRLLFPLSTSDVACLRFWLYVGSDTNALTIKVDSLIAQYSELRSKIFKNIIPKQWISVAITVEPEFNWHSWQVQLEANVEDKVEVYMAVDDLELLLDESCGVVGNCDFEQGNCLWSNHPRNSVNWLRKNGYDTINQAPMIDHTTSLHSGYYTYLFRRNNEKGSSTLTSSILDEKYKCFSFWYWVNIDDVATLELHMDAGGSQSVLLHSSPMNNTENKWKLMRIDIPGSFKTQGDNYQIRFKAIFESKNGLIALDDLEFDLVPCDELLPENIACRDTSGTKVQQSQICNFIPDCPNNFDEQHCGSCDFENSTLCQYSIISSDLVRWTLLSAYEATAKTKRLAPTTDHSTMSSKGHYMIPLPPVGQWENIHERITLHSPVIQRSSATCHLVFWYFAQVAAGRMAELLQVNLITESGKKSSNIFKSTESSAVGQWAKVETYVGQISQPFMLEFSTDWHYTQDSALAVDDISFPACGFPEKSSKCTRTQFTCDNLVCVDPWQVCDFSNDCGDESDEMSCDNYKMCDFEKDSCDWKLQLYGWKLKKASDYGDFPKRDHTLGTFEGGYLVPYGTSFTSARLYSAVVNASSNCTMRFYYFLAGGGVGSLSVKTRSFSNGPETTYRRYDHIDNNYFFIRDQLTFNEESSFEIIFETSTRQGKTIAALDDISFDTGCVDAEGLLPTTTTALPLCSGQFACKSSQCIDLQKVCNFYPDCEDLSDEINCGPCDFDDSWCKWNESSTGMFRWRRQHAYSIPVDSTLPLKDHSASKGDGYYMVIEKTTVSQIAFPSSLLESPIFQSTASSCTIHLWYHVNSSVGSLKVKLKNVFNNEEKTAAVLTSSESRSWDQKVITLGRLEGTYKVIVEADVNELNAESHEVLFDFALDDITFLDCDGNTELNQTVTKDIHCSFDVGLCNWYQEIEKDDLNWNAASGSTPTKGTGPEQDHTTGSGRYLYLESSLSESPGKSAFLVSPMLLPLTNHCLTFFYHMFGEHVNSLTVSLALLGGRSLPLWRKIRSQSNDWLRAEVTIDVEEPFQIRFEGIKGNGPKGDIAIDDISFLDGRCKTVRNFCDFELNTCDWHNTAEESNWNRKTGKQTMSASLPDHTTGNRESYFLLAYISSKEVPAVSVTQRYTSSQNGSCVQLWYVAYPTNAKGENHFFLQASLILEGYPSASDSLTPGKRNWEYFEIDVPPNKDFQVQLNASMDAPLLPFGYVIAIDDFEILPRACVPQGYCNFENGFCGWQNIKSKDNALEWLRSRGKTPSDYTGPIRDNTLGHLGLDNGYYLFIDASSGSEKDRAVLESAEIFNVQPESCFSFFYHMLGEDIGALSLLLLTTSGNKYNKPIVIYTTSGNQGDVWTHASIEIHNLTEKYKLQVMGKVNGGAAGDIAIDDLTLMYGICNITDDTFVATTSSSVTTISSTEETENTVTTKYHTSSQRTTNSLTSEQSALTTSSTHKSKLPYNETTDNLGWIAGIVFGLLFVVALVGLHYYKIRKERLPQGPSNNEPSSFDVQLEDYQSNEQAGIVNPIYGEKKEISASEISH